MFTQEIARSNSKYKFNTEDSALRIININNINALFYATQNSQVMTWTINKKVFTLVCPTSIQLEDMIDIAENITAEDK